MVEGTWLIVDEDASIGPSQVALDQGTILLLTSSIPELKFVLVPIKFAHFCEKVDADGGLDLHKGTSELS